MGIQIHTDSSKEETQRSGASLINFRSAPHRHSAGDHTKSQHAGKEIISDRTKKTRKKMMNTVIRQLVINFIVIEAHYLHRRTATQCDLLNDQILMMENSKWEPSERFNGKSEYFQKRDCEFGRVWDVMFCTRVCELQEGDICDPSARPGLDMCRQDLHCIRNNDLPDNLGVCESLMPMDFNLDYDFYDLMDSMLN